MEGTADAMGETTVLADLRYADGTAGPTSGHKWHVHVSAADAADMAAADVAQRCVLAGGHYNPGNVDTQAAGYAAACAADAAACEVGDLSGRHGQLALPSTGSGKVLVTVDPSQW